jgi:hypothetical protein
MFYFTSSAASRELLYLHLIIVVSSRNEWERNMGERREEDKERNKGK